jgi:hypothetical protein
MHRPPHRKTNYVAVGLFGMLFCGASAVAQTGSREAGACRLHIHVVSKYGRVLPYALKSFVNTKSKLDLAANFNGLIGASLPAGQYRFRLSRQDIVVPELDIEGEVDLSIPEQWLTIVPTGSVAIDSAGKVGAIALGGAASAKPVSGRITPIPDTRMKTWVRCQALFTRDYVEVPVAPDGSFSVPGDLSGTYMLMVLQGEHALGTREVSFGRVGPLPNIEIDLAERGVAGKR